MSCIRAPSPGSSARTARGAWTAAGRTACPRPTSSTRARRATSCPTRVSSVVDGRREPAGRLGLPFLPFADLCCPGETLPVRGLMGPGRKAGHWLVTCPSREPSTCWRGMGGLGARRLKFPLKMPTRGRHPVNSESWEPALPSAAQAPSSRPRCPGAGPGSRVQRSVTGAKGQPDVFGKPVWGAPSGGPGGSWGTVTSRLHPCGHTSGPSGEHGAPGRGRRAFGPSW